MDDEPGIRTNTTICLGKISKHLNDSVSSKKKNSLKKNFYFNIEVLSLLKILRQRKKCWYLPLPDHCEIHFHMLELLV